MPDVEPMEQMDGLHRFVRRRTENQGQDLLERRSRRPGMRRRLEHGRNLQRQGKDVCKTWLKRFIGIYQNKVLFYFHSKSNMLC